MRKYILAIILICLGLSLLIYSYTKNKQTKYSETLFSKEAMAFDKSFSAFIKDVDYNIQLIQSNFSDTAKIKDTLKAQQYFLNFIQDNAYLTAIGFVQNNYQIVTRKEDNSLIYTIDSTEIPDIVRWQRFEKGKLISSWQESLEEPIKKTPWYHKLVQSKDQIQWFLRLKSEENNDELFYAGFSYSSGKVNSIIIMEFSRLNLLKNFKISSTYEHVNLSVKTAEGKKLNLANRIGNNTEQKEYINEQNDSLHLNALNHFKKFDKLDSGTFNFNFENETYWNSFKRFPEKTGILYYLLTIPNKDLHLNMATNISSYLNWIAIILMSFGLVLLFVKKRFFYRSNRLMIPPVKEILKEDENRYLEFKSSSRWDYRQEKSNPELEKVILKTLAAFGNTDGGILLIGVDDDKNILGLEKDFNTLKKSTADYYEIHLRNILHNLIGVKYVSKYIRMKFEICENQKVICKIKVIAADEPAYLKFKNKNGQVEEKFYVRSGNSSQEITSMAEINDYINTRFK